MLGLAAHLDTLSREALLDGLRRRNFAATGAVDVFDLADALLTTDAVDTALERLDRPTLAVLAAAARSADAAGAATVAGVVEELDRMGAAPAVRDGLAAGLERLEEVFLVIGTGDGSLLVPPLLTRRILERLGDSLPSAEALAAAPAPIPVGTADGVDRRFVERRAAEVAHATVTGLAEVIVQLSTQPARELAKGGLALPDARRLAEAATTELEQLPELVGIARRAGLIVREGSEWLETDAGAEWLRLANAARWRELAEIWLGGIRPQLLELTNRRGDAVTAAALREDVAWFYPAGGTRLRDAAEAVLREAEALGITVAGEPSEAGRAVLAGRLADAESAMAALFPEQVDRVYVQHDLTIVSPGPLEPSVDAMLRSFADIEGRDLASSYRVTPAAVNRALAAGHTADAIRSFLERVSLTGIPQPLEYLLSEASERFGSIRVTEATAADAPARSIVRADDPAVLRTLEVDQELTPIALETLGDGRLGSRFPIDIVFWALSDARYPAAAEDAEGRIVRLRRNRLGRIAKPKATVDPLEQLVDRVREASGQATEAGWLARQLESAARSKETLTVSVRMPGGEVSDYLLAPSSVANGRLRARDRRTDIERTLPLSAIASIAPAVVE